MRGTEVTQDQMEAAQDFVTQFVTHKAALEPEQHLSIRWDELIRLIAWYGAVRAEGAIRLGPNVLTMPGHAALAPPKLKLVQE